MMILPKVKGQYLYHFDTSKISYMKVGGICDVLYIPQDIHDMIYFIQTSPKDIPITIIGNLSNTIVTDKGIRGCCISLKNLNKITVLDESIKVECGITINKFIKFCVQNNISCCEKLYIIPGTIGGALIMNAGIPSFEIKDVVESITLLNIDDGNISEIGSSKMSYRNGNIPDNYIAISCILQTKYKDSNVLKSEIKDIMKKRIETQPINTNTCGSTFKNPPGYKAWELINKSGCCGLRIGGAVVSDKHCNFIVNEGNATASDVIQLIKLIKEKVFNSTGILLEQEVKIIGEI